MMPGASKQRQWPRYLPRRVPVKDDNNEKLSLPCFVFISLRVDGPKSRVERKKSYSISSGLVVPRAAAKCK